MARAMQTSDMLLRVLQLYRILMLLDFAQNGAFADLNLRFFQIRFGLLQLGSPFLGVAFVLRLLLVYLMTEIVVLRLSLPGEFQFIRPVKLGQQISRMNFAPVLDQLGQG